MKKSRSLGDYEIHVAHEGFASIRQISSGEIMHSRTAPMDEARKLYVEQSQLAERLRVAVDEEPLKCTPLILWDVGLGAAANAMAAVLCYEELAQDCAVRQLRLVSFENDLDPLRLALQHRDDFPYLNHRGPMSILEKGSWKSTEHIGLSWVLLSGDFLKTISNAPAPPDLIYYDMFSSKSCASAWRLNAFRKLFAASAGQATKLFTYTCSTANRALMLAAGFHVARGCNAGAKIETTIALTQAALSQTTFGGYALLGREWLEKWNRSRAKFPNEIPNDEHRVFEQLIREHPQFRNAQVAAVSKPSA